MSQKLYVGIYAGSLGAFLLFAILCFLLPRAADTFETGFSVNIAVSLSSYVQLLAIFCLALYLVIHLVLYFVILAKMWGAIQDGQTEISVGRAIGYSFIPLFGFYWVFRVWGGYPNAYNNYLARYGIPLPPLSSHLFTAFSIVLSLSFIPIFILITPILFLIVIAKVCDAMDSLGQAVKMRRRAAIEMY